MSKIKIRKELDINCSTKKEVLSIIKIMRTEGFHVIGTIYYSYSRDKYSVTMYSKYKTYKL